MKINKYSAILAVGLMLTGCGGRAANPVLIQQYGDDRKSCESLEVEISQIEGEIQRLMPKTEKTGKNVALGVTGVFFIVPLFFMDLSQAEQIEVEAYRQRYNHLVIMATEKECSKREVISPFGQEPSQPNDSSEGSDDGKTDTDNNS
jgi:hypothetical protein